MTYVDPRVLFSVDPLAKPFMRTFRTDLLDTSIQNDPAQGKVTIARLAAPSNQTLLIKDLVFYVQERTNVTVPPNASESYQTIAPELVEGQVAFEAILNGNNPLVVDSNLNAPSTAGAALASTGSNAIRTTISGVTSVSATPYVDARSAWANWLFSFAVPSDGVLSIVFSTPRTNAASPTPNTYKIPTALVPLPAKRVDFAGVVITGVSMPSQAFAELQTKMNDARRRAG